MIFDLQTIVDFTSNHFGLGEGDIIFTGTPEGVGQVFDGDHLTLKWDNKILSDCFIILTVINETKRILIREACSFKPKPNLNQFFPAKPACELLQFIFLIFLMVENFSIDGKI